MPLEFTIDHDKRFVDVRTSGRVVLKDVEDYFDALMVQGGMPYPKLFDATDVEFDVSDADMMLLGARVSAYAVADPRGPIAIVAVTDEAVNLLRRFINLGGAKRPAKIFRSAEQARQWLDAQTRT